MCLNEKNQKNPLDSTDLITYKELVIVVAIVFMIIIFVSVFMMYGYILLR